MSTSVSVFFIHLFFACFAICGSLLLAFAGYFAYKRSQKKIGKISSVFFLINVFLLFLAYVFLHVNLIYSEVTHKKKAKNDSNISRQKDDNNIQSEKEKKN